MLPRCSPERRSQRRVVNTIGPVWDNSESGSSPPAAARRSQRSRVVPALQRVLPCPCCSSCWRSSSRPGLQYRHQRPEANWHGWWDRAIIIGSHVPALLWGRRVRQHRARRADRRGQGFTGNLFTLLNPFGLLGGVVTLLLFLTHGAMFLALKTDGDLRVRSRALSIKLGLATAVAAVVFMVWAQVATGNAGSAVFFVLAALCLVGAIAMARGGPRGWAFIGTFATIAFAVAGLFVALFPDVMPSSTQTIYSLTTSNASSHYTLTVMTIVA